MVGDLFLLVKKEVPARLHVATFYVHTVEVWARFFVEDIYISYITTTRLMTLEQMKKLIEFILSYYLSNLYLLVHPTLRLLF